MSEMTDMSETGEFEDEHERGYVAGQQSLAIEIIDRCRMSAGVFFPDDYSSERAQTVLSLRRVCAQFGDNDWPDDLHLVDIIEKHLERYLGDK